MSSQIGEFPRDPFKTIKIENVRQESTVEFTKNVERVIEETSWIKKRNESTNSFGLGSYQVSQSCTIRVYSSGKIDCVGMSEPIKAYKSLQEFIFRLKREDLIISSDDKIKVSNISASAVLARPIRLNQLYYRLPSSIEQIQPPEERSNSLRFTLTEDNIHVNKYDDGRLATGINMHVSVFNTGTIQIKGARHPKMIDRAIEVILESITEDCII